MAVTLDTGALVAADRNDRRFWAWWKRATALSVVATVPAAVIAQAWRDGARQANLARVLGGCSVAVMDDPIARRTGELCGDSRTRDVVDACVAVVAALGGDDVLTSDPDDLAPLLARVGATGRVLSLDDLP